MDRYSEVMERKERTKKKVRRGIEHGEAASCRWE